MAYYLVADFQSGLDTRKTAFSAPAGSLRRCQNAHITRGGEVGKRKAFVDVGNATANTFGLHIVRGQLYVFGSGLRPAALSSNIQYQRLNSPNGSAMTRLLSTQNFNGVIYAIAEYADGNVLHFYDGALINDWTEISNDLSGLDAVALSLAQKIEDETGLLVVAAGPSLTITGRFNDTVYNIVPDGNMSATEIQVTDADSPQITRIDLTATYLPDVSFTLTIDGTEYVVLGRAAGTGRTAFTLQDRVYSTAQSLLRFSGFTDPGTSGDIPQPDATQWTLDDGIGAGFINLATQDSGSELLTALASYQGDLAVFSRQAIHIRALAFDVKQMRQLQLLRNIGTASPQSVVSYGESDVFFLSQSGIRSLRARDSSNSAASADVGTPVDDEVNEYLTALPASARRDANAAVEPEFGRYLLSIGLRVYVYSQFPGSKISAWSSYVLPGPVSDFAVTADRFYARVNDRVYLYGGVSGSEYDDTATDVVLPHMDLGSPGTLKQITSVDVGCIGTWDIWIRPDPTFPDFEEYLGEIEGATYGMDTTFAAIASTTHVGFRLRSKNEGPAKLGQVIVHYQNGEAS